MVNFISKYLEDAEEKSLRRTLRDVVPISARECMVEGRKCLNFSSNNYLALADHPTLIEESVKWTNKYGTGSGASRLVTGTIDAYTHLEKRIAEWKGTEAALIIGSGYMANTGVIPALVGKGDVIFADKLNHASLNAGCQLSGAKFIRYTHNDMEHLKKCIERNSGVKRKLLISDTIFSMDGDMADIDSLMKTGKDSGCMIYLDDAHGTGVFGEKGMGLTRSDAEISMGTFSKAMGSYGAYIACSNEMRDYLINRCGSFIYTTALPPGVCGAISAAVKLVQSDEYTKIRSKFTDRYTFLTNELNKMGFDTGNTSTPIIPVILGDNDSVVKTSKELLTKGILGIAIRPPTVPAGKARIRLSVNSAHTYEDIHYLLKAMSTL